MNKDAVEALLQTLGDLLGRSLQLEAKITAIEKTLKEKEPALHDAYVRKLESLRSDRGYDMAILGLEGVRRKLLQG